MCGLAGIVTTRVPSPDALMRVLYLDHTARLSGGELALARLLGALDRSRVEPIVVLGEEGPLRDLLARQSIETHVLPLDAQVREVRKESLRLGGLLLQLRSLTAVWRYARRLARLARQRDADLIYTNSLKSDFYGALAGRLAGIPVIWHMRDRIETGYLPAVTVHVVRLLARYLPVCVVVDTASTLQTLRLNGARPTEVIASGLTREYIQSCQAPRQANRIPQIGIIGRIAAWKGQDVFLQAAAQVLGQGIAARFRIVGSPLFGEQGFDQRLRALAAELGIADRVEFLGFQSDVPAILRSLDILVHASRTPEPFGQVIIEGMAAALPVIATDGGGAREIIENGRTGLLVPMGDADALAQSLAQLLMHPAQAQALAAAGRQHVLEHYTVERSARQSEALYARLLRRAD
jgi:glycosyltransferase involved in cell wall biosynthesis